MIKIEVELNKDEQTYISTCCIGRVISSVIEVVPEDYEHYEDLLVLRAIMEPLRFKLNDAIFRAKLKERER